MPDKFYHDHPPVAMATKFETKSPITRLICQMSARSLCIRVFGVGLLNTPEKFYRDQPPLPWQRNLGQNRYNLACVKDIFEISAYNRVLFRIGLLNDARQILPRPTPVAMATKFGTKLAIIRLVSNISVTTRNVQITSHNIQFNDIHGPTGLTASD